MVTDDLDGVLVSTDSTVRTKTPELTGLCACRSGIRELCGLEGQMCNVVNDADCELLLSVVALFHVAVYSDDIGRLCILGTETVTAGEDLSAAELCAVDSSENVEVQRLADGARLLSSVENRNCLNCFRKNVEEVLSNERSVQANLNETNLFAGSYEVIDNFFDCLTSGTHSDDDLVSIRSTVVVERLVVCADLSVYLVHVLNSDLRDSVIVLVASFTSLEEDIAVLSLAAENRMFRVQSVSSECVNCIPVEHFCQIVIVPCFDLLDLVGGTETVEEVEERNLTLDSGEVSNSTEVHNFLRAVSAQHCITGLTASVDVGVIAENVQRMGSNATCGYVDNAREQLASHLVHVRDHQEKTLGSSISCCECAGCERTVNSTSCTGLGLHLCYADFTAKYVLSASSSVLVGFISHNGRRRDRVDSSNVCERVRNVSSSIVTIHGFHDSCHLITSSFKDCQ